MWDERYKGDAYLFGTEPALFVANNAHRLPPQARILSLADGEGRNSVWLAEQGFEVTALESSPVALTKAARLAQTRGVSVRFVQQDIAQDPWPGAPYDVVLGVFIQFMRPDARTRLHARLAQALCPGGMVMLHGYAPRQVGYRTGGPSQADQLYTLPGLLADFAGWIVLHSADYDADLNEGTGHAGRSALIDFVARAPVRPKGDAA